MLDLTRRGHAWENLRHQRTRFLAVEIGAFAPPKRIKPIIELTLEPIDNLGIEALEAFLADELIQSVLPFNQKVQAPFSILDVKGQEVIHPGRRTSSALGLELEDVAIGALINDLFVHGPGIDDFGHHS